jgi:hypothetical protein
MRAPQICTTALASSSTLTSLRGCKINGLYGVALRASDGSTVEGPVFSLVGCSPEPPIVAKPGTTLYRFKLSATYTECSQRAKGQPPRGSKYWSPVCLKASSGERDIMPPLPAGKYTALFVPDGKWHGPDVKSAQLVVTGKK